VAVGDHFRQVAPVYESLRTTDQTPVLRIRQLLPDRPVTGVDVGCGTGRYSRLLRALLPEGSLLIASDTSAAMLAELQAGNRDSCRVAPLLATAEQLPLRSGSLDLATSFNSVHHFDLGRFLAGVVRVLRPGGQLFIYTRTPEQNARTIWGRYFPGFAEHERRLHSEGALRAAVGGTRDLVLTGVRTLRHPRSSTRERLRAQAEGHHYSTFSLYTPAELAVAIEAFLARLPGPDVSWVDEHLLVVAHRSHAEPDADGPSLAGGRATRRPTGASRLRGRLDVVQAHLSPGHRLAVLGAADHHQPQLLGAALLDRLGHHLQPPRALRAQEVGHVGDAHGQLPAVLDRQVGADGGERLDDRGEDAPVDQAPRLVVVGADLQPASHAVAAGLVEVSAEQPHERAAALRHGGGAARRCHGRLLARTPVTGL
jgi:SAM-dependent methyltransferase